MSDAIWALQRAVYQQLAADPGVTDLVGEPARIYDAPDAGAAFPYIVIGETRVTDWAGVPGGLEHDLRLDLHSRYEGRREVKALANAVYDALQDADLAVDGHRLVAMRFVFADAFPRLADQGFRGAVRFRALTQPL